MVETDLVEVFNSTFGSVPKMLKRKEISLECTCSENIGGKFVESSL